MTVSRNMLMVAKWETKWFIACKTSPWSPPDVNIRAETCTREYNMMHCEKKSLLKSVDGQCAPELRTSFKTGASKKKAKARIQLTKATAIGQ